MVKFLRPVKLHKALEYRAETGARPFAGGTDLMVKYRNYGGVEPVVGDYILFTDGLDELKTLRLEENRLFIGASATLTEILESSLPVPEILRQSLALIAAPGLRNRATLAGNIANASPAGDSLPPLYVLDAELTLSSLRGDRQIALADFITGPGKITLEKDELISWISFDLPPDGCGFYYRKVGTRRANALTKLSVCALWDREKTFFRAAAGAVGPRIVRFHEAENLAVKGSSEEEFLTACDPLITPIDDQRSTRAYRKKVCLNLIKNARRKYLEEV